MSVCAVVPAGGLGTRMGGAVPKQFQNLDGKPILYYTLKTMQDCGLISELILVVPEKEYDNACTDWLGKPEIVTKIVIGGEKRQDSVYNGFCEVTPETDIVLVHDGVRPFLSHKMILETINAAKEFGAAITAIPVNDTIKRVDASGLVSQTVDRENLWRVQTPQAFQFKVLQEAFKKANSEKFYGTDEGTLIEHLGKPVKVVEGSEKNIKITRPEDLELSETFISKV
ncbi:MAG: 2-C-methyl-D-erythritol 4-phosphate cytidylyltransferase [Nitrospinae bacterium]|nr:2-C-methyl-D-erythritol 4-phosphate cytidylyltransferase [Nitrospinota bacterium]